MKIVFEFNEQEKEIAKYFLNMSGHILINLAGKDVDLYVSHWNEYSNYNIGNSYVIRCEGHLLKSEEELKAEESVNKAKEALKSAEESLRVIKEKY